MRTDFVGVTKQADILRNGTTVASGSAGSLDAEIATPDMLYTFFHAYMHTSTGFAHVFSGTLDLAHRVTTWTGDTVDFATVTANQLFIQSGSSQNWAVDDVVVYARTLFYTSFSSTAVAIGQTVTGGTSGATATVDAVETEGTNGVVYLYLVSGDFVSGEALTFSGGGTATSANALPASIYGLAAPVFIRARAPTSDLTSPAEWTRSSGADDYAAIDDPPHTSDGLYLSASATGQKSKHALANAPASLYSGAAFVAVQVGAYQDSGGIGSIRYNVTDGATTNTGADKAVSGVDAAVYGDIISRGLDSGVEWTNTEIDALILELESRP
jgi:hypothetical protein